MRTTTKVSKAQTEVWEWKEKASEQLNKLSKKERIASLKKYQKAYMEYFDKKRKNMKPYESKSGKDSGVVAYKNGSDYITVQFKSGELYKYSYASAGIEAVEEMKKLALENQKNPPA
jgi:hypothetical protein